MTAEAAKIGRVGTWPVVVAAGLLLALRFGFNFGIGNHNTYLLHALRKVHPEVLAQDWLASTQDYHPVFTYVATILWRLDESGWLFALLNVLCIVAAAAIVFLIIRELGGERLALPAYLITAAFMAAGSTYSAAGSYLFSITFQPSTVAAVAYLAATLWFLRQKHFASGLCLALAGAFHVNFAVLAFPLFALAHLFLGRRDLVRRLAAQLGPACIMLAALSPLLLGQSTSEHVEQARYIFQHVLSPQHYLPRTFWTEFVVYYAWCGLATVVGWEMLSGSVVARRIRALWLSSLLLVTVATVLTTAVFLPVVSQLYFWRLAPFTVLLAQIFGTAGLVRHLTDEECLHATLPRTAILILCAAFIWLVFRYHYGEFRFLQYGMLIALAVAFYVRPWIQSASRKVWRVLSTAVMIGVWLASVQASARSLAEYSTLVGGLPQDEARLYAWAATTPTESVFLIPPQLDNFRFNARRAVVADFKSTPVDPEQLLEWYRRVGVVCGRDSVKGFADAVAGYKELDSARAASIEASHRFDFIVVTGDHPFAGTQDWQSVFTTSGYRVYGRTGESRILSQ